MEGRSVEVVTARGTKLFAVGLVLVAEALFVSSMFWGEDGVRIYGAVCAVLYAVGGAAVLFGMSMFRLRVSGSEFWHRTRFGKTIRFGASDIGRISCEKGSSSGTVYYDIRIEVCGRDIVIGHKMKGFDSLAGCIVELYEAGKLGSCKISKATIGRLKKVSDWCVEETCD